MSSSLTREQQAERRRRKRQQRILQSAGDRLDRITGTAHGYSPSPSPSSSTSSLRSLQPSTSQHSLRSVSSVQDFHERDDLLAPSSVSQLRRRTYHEHAPASSASSSTAPFIESPHVVMNHASVSQSTPSLASPAPQPRSMPPMQSGDVPAPMDLANMLANALQQQMPGENQESDAPLPRQPSLLNTLMMRKLYGRPRGSLQDPALKYWNLLHFVSMAWLVFCAFYEEARAANPLSSSHWCALLHTQSNAMDAAYYPLFRHFVTLELLMYGAFRLYHPHDVYPAAPDDDFTLIASRLASPFKQVAFLFLDHRRALRHLSHDIFTVVFCAGLAQVITCLM
ncbi:hypothetical protein BC940DRAFT_303803 [Gongronella butleri]|nr:hypothetical protein BC940DRAFT_303803 [Gongronella butleri]